MVVNRRGMIAGGVIIVLIALAGATLVPNPSSPEPPKTQEQQQAATTTPAPAEINYQGVEGKNALELLKSTHQVETKNFPGIGEMVTSIDGVAADDKHFWAFYVNGQLAQEGAATYMTKTGEAIVWKLEEIK